MILCLNFKPKEKRNQKSKDVLYEEAFTMYKTKTCGKIMLTGSTVKKHPQQGEVISEGVFLIFSLTSIFSTYQRVNLT